VFIDYSGIASGDFERAILENITARAHFLVLLTPSALERCGEPGDWLRREIETALSSRRNIVPLMLEGFDFGTPVIASQLTGTLETLRRFNALNIPADYFWEAMNRLRERYLNIALDSVLQPASGPARQAATEQKAAAGTAPEVSGEELTAQQWFERGYGAADPEEQLRFYGQAIRLKPDYADAFINRGNARRDKGDLEGALQDYDEAVRLKPDDADAFLNRGNARGDQGDLEGAVEDYNEAIRLKPDYAEALYNRGIARSDLGDLEGALGDFDGAIRLQPDDAWAYVNRGNARGDKGDLEGAVEDYNEAIRLKPDYAEALYNRGLARSDRGDLAGAIEDYNEAIRLQPDADAFYSRSLARRAKGDRDGAVADYREALRLGYKA
jgi:tetratricopeptide (TPR) repeat protein